MTNLQALLDAATPRPWHTLEVVTKANRRYAIHAVNHFEALVGALEALLGALEEDLYYAGGAQKKARAVLDAAKGAE